MVRLISFEHNKTTMILAMVGECTCTKKHPHGKHAQGTETK